MVGFFNAWEIGKKENYLDRSWSSWEFIKAKIRDKKIVSGFGVFTKMVVYFHYLRQAFGNALITMVVLVLK